MFNYLTKQLDKTLISVLKVGWEVALNKEKRILF